MGLSKSFEGLARVFVAACVGSINDTRTALQAARVAGASPRDVDEALLLVIAYAGVPRALLALGEWREIEPAASSVPPVADRRVEGQRTFAAVYGARADRIRQELRALHPELHDAIIEDAYGRILARTGLSPQHRELLAVAMLAALGAQKQAAAHAIGARRAGADEQAILDAVGLASPYLAPDEIREARRRIADILRQAG